MPRAAVWTYHPCLAQSAVLYGGLWLSCIACADMLSIVRLAHPDCTHETESAADMTGRKRSKVPFLRVESTHSGRHGLDVTKVSGECNPLTVWHASSGHLALGVMSLCAMQLPRRGTSYGGVRSFSSRTELRQPWQISSEDPGPKKPRDSEGLQGDSRGLPGAKGEIIGHDAAAIQRHSAWVPEALQLQYRLRAAL